MDFQSVRHRLLEMPHTVEDMPFGPGTVLYKVGGKMFALTPDEIPAGGVGHVYLKVQPHLGCNHRRMAHEQTSLGLN